MAGLVICSSQKGYRSFTEQRFIKWPLYHYMEWILSMTSSSKPLYSQKREPLIALCFFPVACSGKAFCTMCRVGESLTNCAMLLFLMLLLLHSRKHMSCRCIKDIHVMLSYLSAYWHSCGVKVSKRSRNGGLSVQKGNYFSIDSQLTALWQKYCSRLLFWRYPVCVSLRSLAVIGFFVVVYLFRQVPGYYFK